ncbi:aminotransferase class V-fold PLP-dependent enzyme [Umezawaea sp. Da 62-37]|uniref:aminotransferase class V-fold PLP-dependent enzyme n=1 Tax=Umezawaea sp. Da 62-37 TaxID=3075927 RepID=UPI0028F7452B|nr:aminotransferase class V-fold PLP-dependent enzyme [Umezawaea sp. Da 62-37]WNV84987.1 aminotransferase class V-fold PLP-dependent enzyme [Umezawaea sp. Da 62-37]
MDPFARLGLRAVVNAKGRYTTLGGSLMAEQVLEAMSAAGRSYVDMFELHRRAGARVAELTRNEAAYVCNGSAAGLFLATLACATGPDDVAIARLPVLGDRDEVVIHRSHRMPMDPAIGLAGVRLVEIGNVMRTEAAELRAALNARTAAVVYMAGDFFAQGALGLPETVAIAHEAGVPVVVDAAALLPPVTNLWHFTAEVGADLAIFSGGKDLSGPQASGMILGRADLVDACFRHGSPHTRLARGMKVGKEEIAGLVAALELYLETDHDKRLERMDAVVATWVDRLGMLPGVRAERSFPNSMGQPVPRAVLEVDPAMAGLDARELAKRLAGGEPSVLVRIRPHERRIFLSPDTLDDDEARLVVERISALVTGRG